MIIYFTDKNLNILGLASTSLGSGYHIVDDEMSSYLKNGTSTYTFTVFDNNKKGLSELAVVGNYVLASSGYSEDDSYDSLFQIIETEHSAVDNTVTIYAEDIGLDLLNSVCTASTQTSRTLVQMIDAFKPSGWTVRNMSSSTGTKTYTWSGTSTTKERLDSVASLFNTEIYYSYAIDKLSVTARYINLVDKRGSSTTVGVLRFPNDISEINTVESIGNLATGLVVSGDNINLVGYSYSYTDPETGDVYSVDSSTGQMRNTSAMKRWSTKIDADGLVLQAYSYSTSDKAILAGEARAALQTLSKSNKNYEISIVKIPKDIRVGDVVNIVNDNEELYLSARVQEYKRSFSNGSSKITLGEYNELDSGIDIALLERLKAELHIKKPTASLSIACDKGEALSNSTTQCTMTISIEYSDSVIESYAELTSIIDSQANLKWYKDDVEITSGITDNGFTLTISSLLAFKEVYRCELVIGQGNNPLAFDEYVLTNTGFDTLQNNKTDNTIFNNLYNKVEGTSGYTGIRENLENTMNVVDAQQSNITSLSTTVNTIISANAQKDRFVIIDPNDPSITVHADSTEGGVTTSHDLVITDSAISFKENGNESVSISDDTINIRNANITNYQPRVQSNGTWIGNLVWIARENGHFSLKKNNRSNS